MKLVALAVLIGFAIAVVTSAIAAGTADAPGAVGGDYPAFYGAGSIAADGDWESLYDVQRQAEAQAGLHGEGEYWYFAYPPQVALAYAPLSLLPYNWSYLVHTALMAGALCCSVLIARPMVAWLRGREIIAVAAALAFWPMLRAITGGSNTALTLLIVVGAWRLTHDGRFMSGGLVLSVLFFKPQFAVPIIGLYLMAGYWRVIVGAAVGFAVFLVSGIPLLGADWAWTWLEAALDFGAIDSEVNGHSAISLVGFTENIFGTGVSAPVVLAWLAAGAVALFLAWLWWSTGRRHLGVLLAISVPGVLLISPHAMSHDGAVIVLTVAVAIDTWAEGTWRPWVVAIWLLGASQTLILRLGFSPGFVMLLVIAWWVSIPVRDREVWLGSEEPERVPVR